MKTTTIRYVAPRRVEHVEIDVPALQPGQILVEAKACGVCAWDLFTYEHGPDAPPTAPPGHEAVGVVRQVAPDVQTFRPGDNVVAGGFARHQVLDAEHAIALPSDIEHYEHWIVEPVACCVNGIDRAGVFPGDRVVVIGCGFMGLVIIQGLRRSLAAEVVGIDTVDARLDLARRFGAARTFNVSRPDDRQGAASLADEGVDIVIEAAGVQPAMDLATHIVRRAGRICIFSWHHGPLTVDGSAWHSRGLEVLNTSPALSADMRKIVRRTPTLMREGVFDLSAVVTHVVPLEHIADLFEAGVTKADGYIKGVAQLD